MFLPVKADFPLPRFPILTVLVCVICLGVFTKQRSDWYDYGMAMTRFCNASRTHLEQIVFDRISAVQQAENCFELMHKITNDPDRNEADAIAEMASNMRPLAGFSREDSTIYVTQMLEDEVRRYKARVPTHPNDGLAYYTGSWNPLTMISSSFAHGDWGHIIFNLIFFVAFAATVEALIGPAMFSVVILAMSLFIGVMCSVGAYATGNHYWTVGLSGIVTGMMGLFTFLLPQGKIRCYYFFIVIFGSVAIPAWLLAAWYIGGDIYRLFAVEDNGIVNVMAHVSGGIAGYLFGFAFLCEAKNRAQSMTLA